MSIYSFLIHKDIKTNLVLQINPYRLKKSKLAQLLAPLTITNRTLANKIATTNPFPIVKHSASKNNKVGTR